jgi:DNA polymerase-3 subunit epsilon
VRGEQRIELDSMRHHRLRTQDLEDGCPLDEALDRLLDWLGNRPILGYCVDFDLAVLDREARRRHGFRLPNARIDLGRAFERSWRHAHPEREPPGLSFEQIAATLGVPQLGRHDAYGDAVTTALCYLRLQAGPLDRAAAVA